MTEFTKEYIRSVRMCSYLIEPPASEVIEHLCDEIERLQVKKVYFEKLANKWSKQYYKDCDQLRVENERLKMGLEKIVEYQKYRFKLLPHKNELLEKVVDIALQALNEEWDE